MKTQNQKSELTKNEKEVLVALMRNAQVNGENGWEYLIDEVIAALNKNEKSVAATVGSLQKKGLVDCYDENEYYFSGEVTAKGFEEFQKIESEVTFKKRKISDMTEKERQKFNEFLGSLPQDSYGNARVEEWLEARGFEITEEGLEPQPTKTSSSYDKYLVENWGDKKVSDLPTSNAKKRMREMATWLAENADYALRTDILNNHKSNAWMEKHWDDDSKKLAAAVLKCAYVNEIVDVYNQENVNDEKNPEA